MKTNLMSLSQTAPILSAQLQSCLSRRILISFKEVGSLLSCKTSNYLPVDDLGLRGPTVPSNETLVPNAIRSALKSDGVICSQGETYWSMLELIVKMQNDLKELFPSG